MAEDPEFLDKGQKQEFYELTIERNEFVRITLLTLGK